MAADEASAVGSLRSINTSQVVYQSTYGPSFAANLGQLSDGGAAANCVSPNAPTATSSCLIDSALASGTKRDRKCTPLNFSHANISYAVFCFTSKYNTADQH